VTLVAWATVPHVVRINVTPVKSTALHHPEKIPLERRGAVGDRTFFFVDGHGRRFSGATKAPILPIRASYDLGREWLELALPNGVLAAGSALAGGGSLSVDFYGRDVRARIVEGDFAEALTAYVGHEVLLARAEEGEALDVRPVTLVSLESVAELARRGAYDGNLSPARFRMTFEIEGVGEPHAEDAWRDRTFRVGEAVLRIGDPVPRCVVTTLDPATGLRDFPTLRVLRDYRRPSSKGNVHFGVYADVLEPGTVRLGDMLDPL
jgi:uncharacterized protein YcbX